MSFGFSVSDFLAVIQLADKVRRDFARAPAEYHAIADELKSLSSVLRDVDDIFRDVHQDDDEIAHQWDITTMQKDDLELINNGCKSVLETLQKLLNKSQELNAGTTNLGLKKTSRRLWERVKWDPAEITNIRNRITSNITLLNAFYARLTNQVSTATKRGVDQLNIRFDDQDRKSILNWFAASDYHAHQQSDLFGRCQQGTGQWLLDSPEFKDWMTTRGQTLFCPGMPGAGKTMIVSIIINHLNNFQQEAVPVKVGIAYLYCNFRRRQEQKSTNLLMNLLKQLVQELGLLPESVGLLYKIHTKGTRPTFEEVSRVLQIVLPLYSQVFIVIDAMDEYDDMGGDRQRLIHQIFELQKKTGANFFATSRLIGDVEREFIGYRNLEIRASDHDIQEYLDGHIVHLPFFIQRNLGLQDEIRRRIKDAVQGMFLLAKLHLGSLEGMKSPKEVRSALEKLPIGSDAYDMAYKEAMERIEGQNPRSTAFAKRILSWISYTKTLTTKGLQYALAVETGETKLDEDNISEIDDMISVCAGLVAVDKESNIIRLVHYTTHDYFERTRRTWFPDAEKDITETCITCLSFDSFSGLKANLVKVPDDLFEENITAQDMVWLRRTEHSFVEQPNFIIDKTADDKYQILDVNGSRLENIDTISVSDRDARNIALNTLKRVIKFKFVDGLENKNTNSNIENSLQISVRCGDHKFSETVSVLEVEDGTTLTLDFMNIGSEPLYLTVLDLTPSWSIEILLSNMFVLGGAQESIQIYMVIPPMLKGAVSILDILKVFITGSPMSFEPLELSKSSTEEYIGDLVQLSALLARLGAPIRDAKMASTGVTKDGERWATRSFWIRTTCHNISVTG